MQKAHLHTITNLRALKPLLLLLILCSWSTQVWGNTATISEGSFKGNRSWSGNHVQSFTISGNNSSYNSTLRALDIAANTDYTITWIPNTGCDITVTGIKCKIGNPNTWYIWNHNDLDVYINSSKVKTVGGWSSDDNVSKTGMSLGNDGSIVLKTTKGANIYSIEITYTITPDAPTAVATTHTICATLNTGSIADDEKLQLNTSSCFTMPGNDSHFYETLSYNRSAAAGTDGTKSNVSNNYFYATQVGTYYVKAKIAAKTNCHAESSYSGNITINVIGHPSSLTMRNDGEVFVKVKEGIAASQLDLNTLIDGGVGDGSVSYEVTSSNKDKATISGSTFSAVDCGTYTIAATKGASAKYAESDPVSFTVEVKKITPTVTTLPTASAIPYLQAISNSTFTGGEATWNGYTVAGSYSWEDGTLTPGAGNSCKAIFTPDDETRFNTTTCMVNVPITPIDQEINWDLVEHEEYASGLLMNATSTGMGYEDTLVMRYFTDHPEWGYIDEDNYLQVRVANKTLQITAWQGGNANWNRVDSVKTITTAGTKPNDTTEITASGITYGDLLSVSQLNGDVKHNGVKVLGKLEWVDSTYVPKAGTGVNIKKYQVNFIPNDGGYSPITFLVAVEVAKANPTFKWNISENLRENSVYNGIVESNNKEEGAAVSILESSEYLTVSGLNLTTLEIGDVKTGEITITASQAESDNYNARSEEKQIIINPRFAVCLPVDISVAADTNTINNMGGAYTGTHSWCMSTRNPEEVEIKLGLVPVKYTQYYGLQLGAWSEGLNDFLIGFSLPITIPAAIAALQKMKLPGTDKMIELNFTGVPESLSFDTKLQKVYYDVDLDFSSKDWKEANQDNPTWKIVQITDQGEDTIGRYNAATTTSISIPLDSTARSVKIILNSPFAGFVQNLEISQRKYIHSYQSSLSFGTYSPRHPLQEPQTLSIYYSSVGTCEYPNDTIVVTTDKPEFFYVDKDTIYSSVGIDQVGKDSVRVRCNDVKVTGAHVIFTSLHSGATLSVPVSSANPAISSGNAKTGIFQTGTEHTTDGVYRSVKNHDFSACFEAGSALFDTLYIYGVSASAINNRQWEMEGGNKVPKVTTSNVHTPCFVYKNDGTQYIHVRTFDAATKTLNIATDKKIAFLGYKPADLTKSISAVHVNGNASIYLNNTEMLAKNAVLELDGTISLYAQGTNILESNNASSIKLAGYALTINGNAADGLALRRASDKPSIDLGGNGSVEINGATLELHNGTRMAIENVGGQYTDGSVRINDGTIIGEATLYLPWNTQINGGTFNTGTVKVYNKKGNIKRPKNRFGELLDRQTMKKDALPDWYGKSNLVEDEFMVHPMLLDESVYVFNGESKTDSLSSTQPDNWNQNNVPEPNSDAYITAPVVITDTLTLNSLTIKEGEGITVTIAPTGGLTIGEDGIFGATKDNLILKADSAAKSETKGMTGFLRIDPEFEEGMPEATVELFSIGYYDFSDKSDNGAKWQYVGSPLASKDVLASSVFKMSWIYSWVENEDGWINERETLKLAPFVGYATTQCFYPNGILLTYKGQLVSNKTDVEINLSWSGEGKGHNVLANSFVAPIDITKFEDGDFENCDSVIYIFNTGSRRDAETADAQANAKKSYDVPGQYLHIPIGSARLLKGKFDMPTIIAPMQGFCVHATKADARITLDYGKLVWTGDYKKNPNTPLRSPKRTNRQEEEVGALQISLYAKGGADNLYILESDQFDANFENGMDARKLMGEGLNIFATEESEQLGVDATNSLVGTHLGVRTNGETAFTMSFSHLQSENELALLDMETNETTDIDEGTEYTFYAEPNSEILGRFQIVERAQAPSTPTGIEGAESDVKVHKFIKDNQLYILKNGVLYNGMGAVVR